MRSRIIALSLLLIFVSGSFAQKGEKPIRIFGYFQNQFLQQGDPNRQRDQNSFLLQQLNLFFQKSISKRWAAFINFELINNFSSSRQWGSFNVEEAWVKYRLNKNFQLKLGLLIPTFNHLNAIKNRTPLLPYVTRPLVYEASLDFIPLEEFVPERAFIQAYGVLPLQSVKFDYALYAGNSPNISTLQSNGQSGLDTTNTFLFGGRVGLRLLNNIKAGVSLTHEKTNQFQRNFPEFVDALEKIGRLRFGADLSFQFSQFFFEGEYISVEYDERARIIEFDKQFYYGTIGWRPRENLVLYGSYWRTRSNQNQRPEVADGAPTPPLNEIRNYKRTVKSPSFGAAYTIHDRIVLKAQYVNINRKTNDPDISTGRDFNVYNLAVSVNF